MWRPLDFLLMWAAVAVLYTAIIGGVVWVLMYFFT
jgi:hypothetical protein